MSEIIRTWSGEEIELASATEEQLIGLEVEAREFKAKMDDTRALVREEVLRRMDRSGSWTMRGEDVMVRAPSPEAGVEKVYDAEEIAQELGEMVDQGLCDPQLLDRVVTTTITRKVSAAGAKILSQLGGEFAAILERHTEERPKARNLTVSIKK